jgi:transcriptional regulator of acetoin/glycerol metabolism
VSQAARLLNIDRVTLYNKIRKYGLRRGEEAEPAGG